MTTFHTTLSGGTGTTTGIVIPDEVVEGLGGGKRPSVRVTVNGYSYRYVIASMGGRFMIGVSSAIRAETGLKAGDPIEVEVVLDDSPREVDVPAELAAALAADPAAQTAWEKLAFSHRKEHARAVAEAKAADTRARRVEKTLAALRQKS